MKIYKVCFVEGPSRRHPEEMSELTDSDNDLMGYNTDELERNEDIERRQAIVIEQSSSTSDTI